MSISEECAQMPANSIVQNTAGKGRKQTTDGPPGLLPEDRLREIRDKQYNQLLTIMAEKVHHEKLQDSCDSKRRAKKRQKLSLSTMSRGTYLSQCLSVFSRLRHEESRSTCQRSPTSTTVFTRLGGRERNVFTRLGERKKDVHAWLGPKATSHYKHASDRIRASIGRSAEDPNHRRNEARNLVKSYATCSNERQREVEREWDAANREDLSQPWLCEETDPFTPRICNFKVPKRTLIPTNVKTYDGTGDPEDHLKIFQTAAKVERWAIPTWCHMFNSTLIGSAKVWFDILAPESIDSYMLLRKAFRPDLGNERGTYIEHSTHAGCQRELLLDDAVHIFHCLLPFPAAEKH
ncbi:hypothetical protein Tco_1224543, partial [Tanacetum coccineum]